MSRLDSAIDRLLAQRACLDLAVELVAGLSGPALELGLGNGRSYDHLRSRLGHRPIYVFERQVNAHPDCVPPGEFLLLGDFRETLPRAAAEIGDLAALVHADIGTGDKAQSVALARAIAPLVIPLMRPGGVLAADQPFDDGRLESLPLPAGVQPGRYHLYRRTDA